MRDIARIPELRTYKHWLEKAKFDYLRYKKTFGLYALTDCLLTLNAIPEWITKEENISEELKRVAENKIIIMKGQKKGFLFNEKKLEDIDQQLRFIRIFCNHSKHGSKKEKLPEISINAPFPLKLPICFEYIQVGDEYILAKNILKNVIIFWENASKET